MNKKELNEIKMLISQVDRKLQGMYIKVIGSSKSSDNEGKYNEWYGCSRKKTRWI